MNLNKTKVSSGFLIIFAFSSLPSFALAETTQSGWKHLSLQSKESAQIEIDYQTTDVSETEQESITASPIWINVSSATRPLGPNDTVRIVLNNYLQFQQDTSDVYRTSGNTIDLTYAGNGRFTAQATNQAMFSMSDDGSGGAYFSTIAVAIDGVWQTNPWPITPGEYTPSDFFIRFAATY